MTCKGYDPKAVKIGKPIKLVAAAIHNPHLRGSFIRGYVTIEKENSRSPGGKVDKK